MVQRIGKPKRRKSFGTTEYGTPIQELKLKLGKELIDIFEHNARVKFDCEDYEGQGKTIYDAESDLAEEIIVEYCEREWGKKKTDFDLKVYRAKNKFDSSLS